MTAHRIVHEVPMRWADLDTLNHVNNVVYLDYAAESRAALVADGLVGATEPIARMAIDFRRPLLLSAGLVRVASSRDGDVLVQEIGAQGSSETYAQVRTTFGVHGEIAPHPGHGDVVPSSLRRSDLGPDGTVSPTKTFELFQELRILFLNTLLDQRAPFVVGRADVLFASPIPWSAEPLEARNWVSRVGSSSVTVESELERNATVLARCTTVLVGFDLTTQRSRELSKSERDALQVLSPPRC